MGARNTAQAVTKRDGIEIDEQSVFDSGQTQVSHELRGVHRKQMIEGFDLDHQTVVDDEVEAVRLL